MTDKQLAILLRQYQARLVNAVAEVGRELPPEMKETRKDAILGHLIESCPVLSSLWAIANDLEQAAENLERQP